MMTSQEALDKAASWLREAEGSVGEQHFNKCVYLAQLYMDLAQKSNIQANA